MLTLCEVFTILRKENNTEMQRIPRRSEKKVLLRGNGEIDRFIFSDHLPLRWVGGLYQEIKSVIDQH